MKVTYGSPYGAIGLTPELQSGENFVEDYALAFELAQTLAIPRPENTRDLIRQSVNEALGPDTPSVDVLAVSSLVAEARARSLRRPLIRNQKELRKEEIDVRLWPPAFIKSIKRQRALLREQIDIFSHQTACIKASTEYLHEAVSLTDDLTDTL
jgi:hypothetical protein